MEEMDADTFAEWRAYDSIEPLDAAGVILRGLSSTGEASSPATESAPAPSWMNQKMQMLHYFNLFGKKKG